MSKNKQPKKPTHVGEQQSKEKGYVNLSSKIPAWVADQLNIICELQGTDIYRIVQMCADFILETAKVTGPVPPQMQLLLNMMKVSVDWNKAFSFSNPTAQLDIAQVVLILQQHKKGLPRQGFGLAMIDKPYATDPQPTMTTCVDDILERLVQVSMPGLYKKLMQVGKAMESQSLCETLIILCDQAIQQYLKDMDAAELPQIGEYTDIGKTIAYGQRKRILQQRRVDEFTKANSPIIFSDQDFEAVNHEAGKKLTGDDIVNALGCHPIGVEP